MTITEWVHTYTQCLPPYIRPAGDDQRFIAAARTARDNQWAPRQAAVEVTARDYHTKANPTLIAIMRLEELAATNPATDEPRHAEPWQHELCDEHAEAIALDLTRNQCKPCRRAHGVTTSTFRKDSAEPPDPANTIPHEWLVERWRLIHKLANTPALTQQQRGQAMADLIAEQKTRD